MVEPEKWQRVPLLIAEHEGLRRDILDVPLRSRQGRRLKYVSPWQVQHAPLLNVRWEELRQRAEIGGEDFELEGVDKQVSTLVNAYERFGLSTFNPAAEGEISERFFRRQRSAAMALEKLARSLQRDPAFQSEDETRRLVMQTGVALQRLFVLSDESRFSLEKVDAAAAEFRGAADVLAEKLAGHRSNTLSSLSADLSRQTGEMQLALYDNGYSLRLVPALNPGALEETRLPGDDAQPWLSLLTLIHGSPAVLRNHPEREIREVREAFKQVKADYLDREDPRRPQQFSAAMERFAAALRGLADEIEPLRKELPVRHRDEELVARTAYPPPGYTDVEVWYNRLDPFYWSWVVSLAALICYGLAFGVLRRPMFWAGTLTLVAAILVLWR